MKSTLKKQLAHVLWIGGATDSGKSSVARTLARRHGFPVYHYDKDDAKQIQNLADVIPQVRQFLNASMEERWVHPTPRILFDHLLIVFSHRFHLVVENLLNLPRDKPLIVEGFGLLPELLHPVLSSYYQALWFVSTEKFKWESMVKRGKPSFASSLSDPEKARMNIFTRDMMLADYYRKQAALYEYTLYEIDGSKTIEEVTDLAETHFAEYLTALALRTHL